MIAVQSTGRRCRRTLGAWLQGHRGPVEPTPPSWQLLPPVDVRIAEIEAIGAQRHSAVRVLIDPHFAPGACGWCDPTRPDITTVRIVGNPIPLADAVPLRTVEVCHAHAVAERGALRQALVEAGQHRLVRVEVCE